MSKFQLILYKKWDAGIRQPNKRTADTTNPLKSYHGV
jgi:hypothetical protein